MIRLSAHSGFVLSWVFLICRPVNCPCYHEASPYEEGDISIYSLRRKHVCLCLPHVLDLFAFVSFSLN